jgi:hypothetical protein
MRDDFPDTITLDQVRAALHALGLPVGPDDLHSVHMEPGKITVVHGRSDSQGRWLAAGQDLSTVTTVIGIDLGHPDHTDIGPR